MLLLNALYFDSKWKVPFINSVKKNFSNFGKNDKKKIIDMMISEIINRPYLENEQYQAVKLEYVNKNFESIVILPKVNVDIETFIKNFDYISYKNLVNGLKSVKVNLSLPKFKVEYSASLKEFLINLGMKNVF